MLKLNKITKKYEKKILFQNLTYEFKRNSLYVISGESGFGKTTLLDILYEITKPSSGSVVNNGVSVAYDALESFLLKEYSVFENLCYILKIKNEDKNIYLIEKYLKLLNIYGCKHKNIDHLSLGQKKRVGLVATLLLDCDYYILDEPYADLDMANRNRVTSLIKIKLEEGKAVIITSHQRELLNDFNFNQFKVSDKVNIFSYHLREKESENIIKKPFKIFLFKDLLKITFGFRHLMIALMIAIFSLSILFFENNYLNKQNYFDENIFVMNNTNDLIIEYYESIFDYISGDLEYIILDLSATVEVIALPVSIYSKTHVLKENEVIISSLIYDLYKDKSFESLGVSSSDELIDKTVYFNENKYIVKDVIDLDTNVIYLSDEVMRNDLIIIAGKRERLNIIKDEIILKEGIMPTNNNKYIEIIGDISLNVGDIIDDVFLVTGISNDNNFYIREDDFKKHYLQNVMGKKVLYSNDKSKIENTLKISSISYKNLKDEADIEYENLMLIQNETNQDFVSFYLIVTIVLVLVVAIIDFYKVKNRIDMHRFMKNSSVRIYTNIIFNVVFKYLIIYAFSILFFYLLKVVLIYIFNSTSFSSNLEYLFKYGLLCIATNIVIISALYLLNKGLGKLNNQIRKN